MQAIYGYVNVSVKMEPIKVEEPVDKKKKFFRPPAENKEEEE